MNNVEDILKQYPYIGEDIQKAQKELNRYIILQIDARDPLKAQKLTDMPHGYDVSMQTENAVVRLIDEYQVEINKYSNKIKELIDLQRWLDKAFSELTEDERRVVILKYDKNIAYSKIAYIMRKSRNYIPVWVKEIQSKIKRFI